MPTESLTDGEPSMKLWSWQTAGFNICRDRVDLGESHNHTHGNSMPEKYKLVSEKLKTKDILWCFTVETDWKGNKNQACVDHRVCWTLKVPISRIACFVDDWLADSLLTGQPYVDIAMRLSLRKQAINQYPKSQCLQKEFVVGQLRKHGGSPLPPGTGWSDFFLKRPIEADYISALLLCPIEPAWVVKGPADTHCVQG